jgi:filamentous hemagglutinin
MAKSFLTDLNLNRNVLLNAKIQQWGSAPSGIGSPDASGNAVAGQISSYSGSLYIFNGSAWVQVGGGTVTIGSTAVTVNGSAVTTFTGLSSVTSTSFTGALTGNVTGNVSGSAGTVTGLTVSSGKTLTVSNTLTLSASNDTSSLNIGTGGTLASGAFANIGLYATLNAPTFTGTVSGITSAMVGLGNVTNESKATMFSSPTFTGTVSGVTATHVGLGNVTNESKATMFTSPTFTGTVAAFTSGAIAMGNNKITGLGTPTADTDAATKLYVDQIAAGLHVHPSVNYATTGALGTSGNLVGGTITTTYNNGTSGVGATLTIATSSNWTNIQVDGQTVTANDRILIKNQGGTASNLQNGIYTVTSVGAVGNTTSFVFTRAVDADQSPEIDAGDLTYVVAGTVNGGDGYVQVVNSVTVGTTAIQWSQFSGSGAVPIATVTSAGLASFPDAQFSVSGAGAVSIDNLGTLAGTFATSGASALTLTTTGTTNATLPSGTVTLMSTSGNTTGSAATLTTTRTIWGQNFNGSADVTGALSSVTTITGTTTLGLLAPSNASNGHAVSLTGGASSGTSGQTGGAVNITGGASTSGTTLNTGGSVTIAGGAANTTNGVGGNVNINGGLGSAGNGSGSVILGGSNTLEVQIAGVVRLPGIATGSDGFVKIAATTGTLSRATIAYSDLPTSSLTAVTTDGIARKKTGPGVGTSTNTFSVNHGFGQWVIAQLYDSSGNQIEVDIQNTSTSNGTTIFTFAANQTNMNVYQYVIIG